MGGVTAPAAAGQLGDGPKQGLVAATPAATPVAAAAGGLPVALGGNPEEIQLGEDEAMADAV